MKRADLHPGEQYWVSGHGLGTLTGFTKPGWATFDFVGKNHVPIALTRVYFDVHEYNKRVAQQTAQRELRKQINTLLEAKGLDAWIDPYGETRLNVQDLALLLEITLPTEVDFDEATLENYPEPSDWDR